MLRGVLESKPRQIKQAELRQALDWTLEALGRDVIADDLLPGSALLGRIAPAREADAALLNRRIPKATARCAGSGASDSRLKPRRQSHAEYRRAFLADAFAGTGEGSREQVFSCPQKSPSIFCTHSLQSQSTTNKRRLSWV
jgi:hypothetical protein